MKKRLFTMVLAAALSAGLLAGCGAAGETDTESSAASSAAKTESTAGAAEVEEAVDDVNALETPATDSAVLEEADEIDAAGKFSSDAGYSLGGGSVDASFVLIYNPKLFDEQTEAVLPVSSLNTGDLSTQIITALDRAGGLDDSFTAPEMLSQDAVTKDLNMDEMNRDGAKAGGLDPVYRVGDIHPFYYYSERMDTRLNADFDCIYVGEHCYIWSLDGSVDEASAEVLGKEFDEVIYQKDVDTFGSARFTENGGKINMLFYPMPGQLGGFFNLRDNFAGTEVPEAQIIKYGMNTDHAIININSTMIDQNIDFVKSTLAHEFQHLICGSEYFYHVNTPMMRTWLNEAMSAYAEEMIYPGIKETGHYNEVMYMSDAFRKGQSLYNFSTEKDEYIGAYGAVYLFSQYLAEHAGDDVFTKVHEYWRTTEDPEMSEATCLASIVPESFKSEIDAKYNFPAEVSAVYQNESEEWLAKMTLDFFIEAMSEELPRMEGYQDAIRAATLYTEVNPQDVEGGGRMLVATENGSYTIPDDADEGLLYIGLDQNFNVIGDPIMR